MRIGFGVASVAALLVGAGCARSTAPPSGQQLYARHCAACHGLSGTGDGPLADTLKQRPADLTAIARKNGGVFDHPGVMATIDGRRAVREHGPREMPVWGAVFGEELAGEPYGAYTALLHDRALADYVQSIQR